MTMLDTSTPVLVLNAIHYGALGLSRSLGRLGVTVYNQSPQRSVPVFFSKYSRRNILWDIDAKGAERTIDFLISLGDQLPCRAILIPTCDVTAVLVADHDAVLRKSFIFPERRPELVHALCSKRGMYELARSFDIPTPETSFPESRREVLRFLECARFPVVLKTIQNRLGQQGRHGIKRIVHGRDELLRLYDELEDLENPNLMLQEYIPGNEDTNWMFNGYFDRNSDCLIGLTGKKIRQFPAYAGVTSLGVCLTNEVVEATAKAFMKAIGYKGVLDCGFRFDARDGRYKVYDINPRIGATFRLFVDDLGLDVARVLYMDMTGQPVTAGTIQQGRKWIVEDCDLVSSVRYCADRRLAFNDWVHSLRGIHETALFASDDPWPVCGRVLNKVHRGLLCCKTLMRRNGALASSREQPDHTVERQPGSVA
jgi:D-aspartate ligase